MIRLIALHGKLSGSVVLKSAGGKTEIILKTRSLSKNMAEDGLSAFLIAPLGSNTKIVRADIVNGSGSAEIEGVRGIVLAHGGVIIAEGSNGLSETALERAKVQLRLKFPFTDAAGTAKSSPCSDIDAEEGSKADLPPQAQNDEPLKPADTEAAEAAEATEAAKAAKTAKAAQTEDNAKNEQGVSPVTRRILSQAKALFGGAEDESLSFENSEPPLIQASPAPISGAALLQEETRRTEPAAAPYSPDSEAVKNPFPALFPNSTWRKTAGEKALTGKVKHRGRLYSITAVPRDGRFPPNELSLFSNIRLAKDANGRQYWLGIRRI